MSTQRGFLLIFTLCFVSLISLLVLSSMNQVMIFQQASAQRELVQQDFYQLERLARSLINAPKARLKSCMFAQDLANSSINSLLQGQGCRFNLKKNSYFYLIEDLGVYPCFIVINESIMYSSQHFRFTVLSAATEKHGASLMQLRVIKPIKLQSCNAPVHYVNSGISSWRYLSHVAI